MFEAKRKSSWRDFVATFVVAKERREKENWYSCLCFPQFLLHLLSRHNPFGFWVPFIIIILFAEQLWMVNLLCWSCSWVGRETMKPDIQTRIDYNRRRETWMSGRNRRRNRKRNRKRERDLQRRNCLQFNPIHRRKKTHKRRAQEEACHESSEAVRLLLESEPWRPTVEEMQLQCNWISFLSSFSFLMWTHNEGHNTSLNERGSRWRRVYLLLSSDSPSYSSRFLFFSSFLLIFPFVVQTPFPPSMQSARLFKSFSSGKHKDFDSNKREMKKVLHFPSQVPRV